MCSMSKGFSQNDVYKQELSAISTAYMQARALHSVAQLEIPDELVAGPKSAGELAYKLGLHEDSVYRLLRMLAEYGLFKEQEGQVFSLTAKGRLLTKCHSDSLLSNIQREDRARWNAMGELNYSLCTGQPAFDKVNGKSFYEYIKSDPDLAGKFNRAMAQNSEMEKDQLLRKFDFSSYATIADIGGGNGAFLGALLAQYPKAKGVIFDLEETFNSGLDPCLLKAQNRYRLIAGDFFKSIPVSADLFFIKRTLHNWSNDQAIAILKSIKAAMVKGKTLLIAEGVATPGSTKTAFDFDVLSLVLGGRLRSHQEFELILSKSGFKLLKVQPLDGRISLLQAEAI